MYPGPSSIISPKPESSASNDEKVSTQKDQTPIAQLPSASVTKTDEVAAVQALSQEQTGRNLPISSETEDWPLSSNEQSTTFPIIENTVPLSALNIADEPKVSADQIEWVEETVPIPSPLDALEALLGTAVREPDPVEDTVIQNPVQPFLDSSKVKSEENITSAAISTSDHHRGLSHGESGNAQAINPEAALDMNRDAVGTGEAEWEVDSDPYESSDSSTDSDDSSSDEGVLLSAEEQARILMEVDSDEERDGPGKNGGGIQPRTKHEIVEEVIPKPDVIITSDMKIEVLGAVQSIVESMVVVSGKASGEHKVLETGSVVCLEDRSVIGVISETLGRVQQPFYCIRFTNDEEIKRAGVSVNTKIFYAEQHATYVFTHAIKGIKGSDASNLFDEEVAGEDIEFSDDEAEAEHKRKLKRQRAENKRGGNVSRESERVEGARREHPSRQEQKPLGTPNGLNYDDNSDDGLYKPLRRPGLGQNSGANTADVSSACQTASDRGYPGLGRGKGERGRGRGQKGRGGRLGFQSETQPPLPQVIWQPQPIPGSYVPGQQFTQFSHPPPPSQFQQGM